MKKFVKCGLGYVRDAKGNLLQMTREALIRHGKRTIPADLKAMGFGVSVWEGDEYFRLSFGRKA